MRIRVFEEFRTERDFSRWVKRQAAEIRRLAFENRQVIDKRSLEREIGLFSSLEKAWKPMKGLRRRSKDYDLIVSVNGKGYHRITLAFPVTREDLDRAADHRRKAVARLGRWGSACYDPDEALYDTYKDALDTLVPFAERGVDAGTHSYPRLGGDPFIRTSQISSFL